MKAIKCYIIKTTYCCDFICTVHIISPIFLPLVQFLFFRFVQVLRLSLFFNFLFSFQQSHPCYICRLCLLSIHKQHFIFLYFCIQNLTGLAIKVRQSKRHCKRQEMISIVLLISHECLHSSNWLPNSDDENWLPSRQNCCRRSGEYLSETTQKQWIIVCIDEQFQGVMKVESS